MWSIRQIAVTSCMLLLLCLYSPGASFHLPQLSNSLHHPATTTAYRNHNTINTKLRLSTTVGTISTSNKTSSKLTSYVHTARTRAIISAANKGKTPWNKGKEHSFDTKAKIREGLNRYALQKREQKAKALNMTLEEYERTKKRKSNRPVFTNAAEEAEYQANRLEAVRKREERKVQLAQERLEKLKWLEQNPRPPRIVSEETKQKISEALKKRREGIAPSKPVKEKAPKLVKPPPSQDQNEQSQQSFERKQVKRSPEHREKIAEAIRKTWQDPEYRKKMENVIKSRVVGKRKNINSGSNATTSQQVAGVPNKFHSNLMKVDNLDAKVKLDLFDRAIAFRDAKQNIRSKQTKLTIREQVDKIFWNQEKLVRLERGEGLLSDDELEAALMSEPDAPNLEEARILSRGSRYDVLFRDLM